MNLPDLSHNSSFLPTSPGFQFAWDSTSLGELKTCPRKYYYTIICGYQPKTLSRHLIFGLHYHSALEHYDKRKSLGDSHETAVLSSVHFLLKETWDFKLGRPWSSFDSHKNRYTLLRTVIWYLDHFAKDSIETIQLANGSPAVELSFRYNSGLTSSSGDPIFFCGHLDRLGKLNDAIYIVDRKTSTYAIDERFFQKFSPDNQFSMYSLSARIVYHQPIAGLIVDGAQIGVNFSRFYRGLIPRTETQLDEWFLDTSVWIQLAESYAKASHWPMNDKACGNYGGCDFREICSKNPSAREQWLQHGFSKRTWDPLISRGDV